MNNTREIKRSLLDINLVNITNKLKSKKTLTSAEIALLEKDLDAKDSVKIPTKRFTDNFVELAKELGVHRKTLYEWKKLKDCPKPTSNGKHSMAKWRAFVAKNGLKEKELSDFETLKDKKLKIEIEQGRIKLEALRGNYVSTQHVEEVIVKWVGQARSILESKLLNELPPILTSLSAVEIRDKLQEVIEEAYIAIGNCADVKESKNIDDS